MVVGAVLILKGLIYKQFVAADISSIVSKQILEIFRLPLVEIPEEV